MRYTILALLLVTVFPSTAEAIEFSGSELFIPVVTDGAGAFGSYWRTDVIISSRDEHLTTDVVMFLNRSGFPTMPFRETLPPRATITLTNFLGKAGLLFSSGTLFLATIDSRVKISAHVRIYNSGNPAGEFGQSVPAIAVDKLGRTAWLHGLNGTQNQRTNIAIANPNLGVVTCSITWIDKNGVVRATETQVIAPFRVVFHNDVFSHAGVPPDEGLTARIDADLPIYALGSVIRNDSGDAYTIIGNGEDD